MQLIPSSNKMPGLKTDQEIQLDSLLQISLLASKVVTSGEFPWPFSWLPTYLPTYLVLGSKIHLEHFARSCRLKFPMQFLFEPTLHLENEQCSFCGAVMVTFLRIVGLFLAENKCNIASSCAACRCAHRHNTGEPYSEAHHCLRCTCGTKVS